MLDHGLEVVANALKLRRSHLLPAGSRRRSTNNPEAAVSAK